MDSTRGDKRAETSIQFHRVAVLHEEFFQKACLINRTFDADDLSFNAHFIP